MLLTGTPQHLSNFRNQALAQFCAFHSPEAGVLSAIEMFQQLTTGTRVLLVVPLGHGVKQRVSSEPAETSNETLMHPDNADSILIVHAVLHPSLACSPCCSPKSVNASSGRAVS